MVNCKIFYLVGLRVDNVGSVGNLLINELFVGDIDQGSKIDDGDGNERKTPERKEFNEPVGN